MLHNRKTRVFTDVSNTPKQPKAVIIAKVFIGSSMIFYGLIIVGYFLINSLFIPAGFCSMLPIFGIKIMQKPDPNKQLKKDMKKLDRYNSLT
ncbi:MAG: hypothetical protein AB7U85_08460 [Alphaproteobacteria bacterium]